MKALLALALLAAAPVAAQPKPSSSQTGRFQIVNPTPDRTNTMLLDTQTGDVWLTCLVDGTVAWCKMRVSDYPPGAPTAQR